MKTTLLAATAALILTGAAKADLTGTVFTLDVNHNGAAGMVLDLTPPAPVLYGTPQVYTVPPLGTWTAVSGGTITTPGATGFDNSLQLLFGTMAYTAFLNDPLGIAIVDNLSENVLPGSVQVFVNGSFAGTGADTGDGFQASWSPAAVLGSADKSVLIVWNSVPAPGAVAFLGLAGLTSRRRRRRA